MADNLDKFGISLELDVSGLQAELIKAQNELRGFQAQLKKSTDTAEISQLTASISNLDDKIVHLNQAIRGIGKPTGDATQSLINLSRIAQDAPYGFLGIANNLNPMLESFQRLQKEAGGSSQALKAMVAGLAGPAGLGVALGVVSSLIVAYGKDLGDWASGVSEAEKKQAEFDKSLKDASKVAIEHTDNLRTLIQIAESSVATDDQRTKAINAVKEAIGKVNKDYVTHIQTIGDAKQAVIDYTNALIQQAVVQRYQKEISDKAYDLSQLSLRIEKEKLNVLNTQKSLQTSTSIGASMEITAASNMDKMTYAQKGLNDATKQYNQTLKEKQDLQKGIDKAIEVGMSMPLFTDLYTSDGKNGAGKKTGENGVKEKLSEYDKALKAFNESLLEEDASFKYNNQSLEKTLENKIKLYENFIKKLAGIDTTEAKQKIADLLGPKSELISQSFDEFAKSVKEKAAGGLGYAPQETKLKDTNIGQKVLLNAFTGEMGTTQSDASFERGQKRMNEFYADLHKKYAEAEKDAKSFANVLSRTVTQDLMGLWDAMQKGESISDALGNMFAKLTEQLIAMVVQAAIFAAILEGLGFGGTGAGFGDIFGQLLGLPVGAHAEGGITTGPSFGLIGEAGPEAIMPLSKLGNMMNSTFNAGAMSGANVGGGNGQFVLKGQDLILAINRSNASLNLRRGF